MSVVEQTKGKMLAVIEHFKIEIKQLRTGRANPSMVDGVIVEAYGGQMKLKEVASATAPDARTVVITPFDAQLAGAICKGIEKANLNVHPIIDGNVVRIPIPPMDESVRKDMVKISKKKGEEAKVSIREVRRKQNDLVRKQKTDGELQEDQVKKCEKMIQDLTDQYCKEIDDLLRVKEKEIMTV